MGNVYENAGVKFREVASHEIPAPVPFKRFKYGTLHLDGDKVNYRSERYVDVLGNEKEFCKLLEYWNSGQPGHWVYYPI